MNEFFIFLVNLNGFYFVEVVNLYNFLEIYLNIYFDIFCFINNNSGCIVVECMLFVFDCGKYLFFLILCFVNVWVVKLKIVVLLEYIYSVDMDIFVVIEIWFIDKDVVVKMEFILIEMYKFV